MEAFAALLQTDTSPQYNLNIIDSLLPIKTSDLKMVFTHLVDNVK